MLNSRRFSLPASSGILAGKQKDGGEDNHETRVSGRLRFAGRELAAGHAAKTMRT
jgi:hypothetical protein